ncbi:MAG: tRNA 2-thiouridine(34) synthase MnmA [Firmicutes bacterium]|nr:tRNA 2-thiouridine(34) synthase MnmA [Alicyclobacillaceae bacterium]MCL6496625.1 tRNA 2-thiouridine(34) synthase MnmA [Bacillota bacterium]
MPPRVVVGMSGGVDSSMAAALLLEQGYEVIGVTLRHLPPEAANSCCSLEAMVDARRVARHLGIAHHWVDVEAAFFERVILPFEAGYLAGITPNPCAWCNRHIKFGALWEWARAQGADYLATGHYARIRRGEGGYELWRARDRNKDQSYLLYTLGQRDLAHLLFPLGEYWKDEVRAMARARGLLTAEKPDSQELCFVPGNDYHAYLLRRRPEAERPGEVVDTAGQVLGRHRGIAFYTVGQRRGLGIAAKEPHYVVDLDPETNRVVVGRRPEAYRKTAEVGQVAYVADRVPEGPVEGTVKIRYNMEPVPATWTPVGPDRAVVAFAEPQWAVTPGQVAVLYQGERVVGGGRIQRQAKPPADPEAMPRQDTG